MERRASHKCSTSELLQFLLSFLEEVTYTLSLDFENIIHNTGVNPESLRIAVMSHGEASGGPV